MDGRRRQTGNCPKGIDRPGQGRCVMDDDLDLCCPRSVRRDQLPVPYLKRGPIRG